MIRNFSIVCLALLVGCSPSGSATVAASGVGPTSSQLDLFWLSFDVEPQGPVAGTAVVTPGGMLGISGAIGSSDPNFNGEVEVRCELDMGAAGDFSITVSMLGGSGSFYREVMVSQLNVSVGQTYLIDGIIDPGNAWQESGEGGQNVTSNVGWAQFVSVQSSPQGVVDLVAVTGTGLFSPGSVLPGAPLSVYLEVENNGSAAAGAFSVSFYASINTVISSFDELLGSLPVAGIPAGGVVQVTSASLDTSGLNSGFGYYIGWVLDESNSVAESDEGNNVGYIVPGQLVVNAIGGSGTSYSVSSQPTGSYNTLSGGRTVLFDGTVGTYDDQYASVAAPFAIEFFGQSVSTLRVSTNGIVSFASATNITDYANAPIPTANTPNGYAAVFWDDLVVGTTDGPNGQLFGEISYEVVGTAPSRVLKIEYINVHRYSSGGFMYGQLWIHERPNGVNSKLELVYPAPNFGSWLNVSATIGIESPSGQLGYGGPSTSANISTKPTSNYQFQ